MPPSAPSIVIILTWFGPWPDWMRFFLASCAWNPSIDWAIWSDQAAPSDLPPNVRVFTLDFDAYSALVAERLDMSPRWRNAYKLCDLKPALGWAHRDLSRSYDRWGFGDLDVIYGDIRATYDPATLDHDLVSSHDDIVSGHLSILRTTPRMLRAFEKIPGWRDMLSRDEHVSFDEQVFSRLFLLRKGVRNLRRFVTPYLGGGLFVERHSTDLPPRRWIDGTRAFPRTWRWREGKLTADGAPGREFLYLHFSHWQSDRWTPDGRAAWKTLARLDNCPPGPLEAFEVSAEGFSPARIDAATFRPLARARRVAS